MPRIERFDDVRAFYGRVSAFLLRAEAEHNLLLGLRSALERDPHVFGPEDPLLAAVVDRGEVVGAAVRTPPHDLILSLMEPDAVDALADELAAEGLPGVNGPVRASRRFAERWTSPAEVAIEERIYRADSVVPPRPVGGAMRHATDGDRELLVRWMDEFYAEAMPGLALGGGAEFMERRRGAPGALCLWEEDGAPVSFLGYGSPTPNGMRIGPVYTPPERRGRGFASALTAAATEEVLASGKRFCFLYTNLANPTSNSIYQQVGYRPVIDVNVWRFGRA